MPTLPTCLQPPPKDFCAICGHQFTLRRLTQNQRSYQTSNPSNLNLHDHSNEGALYAFLGKVFIGLEFQLVLTNQNMKFRREFQYSYEKTLINHHTTSQIMK